MRVPEIRPLVSAFALCVVLWILAPAPALAQGFGSFVSPGPLCKGHKDLDTIDPRDCLACHAPGRGPSRDPVPEVPREREEAGRHEDRVPREEGRDLRRLPPGPQRRRGLRDPDDRQGLRPQGGDRVGAPRRTLPDQVCRVPPDPGRVHGDRHDLQLVPHRSAREGRDRPEHPPEVRHLPRLRGLGRTAAQGRRVRPHELGATRTTSSKANTSRWSVPTATSR